MPSGGGFSSVPQKTYLNIPIRIAARDGVVGWIGFTVIQRKDLTLADVCYKQAKLVAVLSDGKDLTINFPKCDLPHTDQ